VDAPLPVPALATDAAQTLDLTQQPLQLHVQLATQNVQVDVPPKEQANVMVLASWGLPQQQILRVKLVTQIALASAKWKDLANVTQNAAWDLVLLLIKHA
jgi:hypothetical protein